MLIALLDCSVSHNISCIFEEKYFEVESFHYCNVVGDFHINSFKEAYITSSNLTAENRTKTKGIRIYQKTCIYFPQNLENVFDKLEVIEISYGHLKEIHQENLKPFVDLKVLYLEKNDLEILENGLFENNLKLQFIFLESNKIKHIDTNVFENLTALTHLHLRNNDCINININNKPLARTEIRKHLDKKCKNNEYVMLYNNLTHLEDTQKNLTLEDFQSFYNNLTIIEDSLVSQFQNSSLVKRVHVLKDWSFEVLWKNVSSINHLVTNLSETIFEQMEQYKSENLEIIESNNYIIKTELDEKIRNNLNLIQKLMNDTLLLKANVTDSYSNYQPYYQPFWIGVCSILVVISLIILIKNYFAEDRVISYNISDAKRYVKYNRYNSVL